MKTSPLFEAISVNVTTGAVSYPRVPGFALDMEKVYSTLALFLPHCGGSVEMACRHAIHQQIIAHKGMMELPGTLGGVEP